MLNAEILREAEQRRLAWRCRRGMLELDIVLQQFVIAHFNGLTMAEMAQLDTLLELPDNVFWELIQDIQTKDSRTKSLAAQYKEVLRKLRASRPSAEQETA
ncbi:MAG TPA: succinate dehydrogenase assembly factor 2 [Methylophilus sp.]|uniref:FAD assembly factor SdhE n=1 Tax=Methylophilus sp. TaxID=29541 RepID=UPI002C4784BB|nr:succinate dehydrogenase assembly factor 2 [Methylophilus sp.]HSH86629.1 succinate dehydrogenase assembly factor 2 [Methylophilus sp.]